MALLSQLVIKSRPVSKSNRKTDLGTLDGRLAALVAESTIFYLVENCI